MQAVLEVKNLEYAYDEKQIIKKIDFVIQEGSITTIIGNTGGGKTTLVKLLSGLLHGTGSIHIFGYAPTVYMHEVGVVLENNNHIYVSNTVFKTLILPLENLKLKKQEIEKYANDIIEIFDLKDMLDCNPENLDANQRAVLALATALVTHPKLLILDDAFVKVSKAYKKKIMRVLKALQRKWHLTILQVTHDIDDVLFGDRFLILHQGNIVLDGNVAELSTYEKELKKYHYQLPFMVELSLKLQYYNVVDETILDMNRMVNTIWK